MFCVAGNQAIKKWPIHNNLFMKFRNKMIACTIPYSVTIDQLCGIDERTVNRINKIFHLLVCFCLLQVFKHVMYMMNILLLSIFFAHSQRSEIRLLV